MKRILSLALLLMLLTEIWAVRAFAFAQKEHDNYTEYVLFGQYHAGYMSTKQRQTIDLLENALYLTIDQYNGDGQDKLNALKNAGIPNLPALSKIDYRSNYTHRKYTHQGWNYNYSDDVAHWDIRKNILHSTAQTLFPNFRNTKQCDAFCALMYYIHVLADGLADVKYDDQNHIPVGGRAGASKPDVIQEIIKYLPVLFPTQTQTNTYRGLVSGLQSIDSKMTRLAKLSNGINSETFAKYQDYAEQAMKILNARIYRLLCRESFFIDVFPTQ